MQAGRKNRNPSKRLARIAAVQTASHKRAGTAASRRFGPLSAASELSSGTDAVSDTGIFRYGRNEPVTSAGDRFDVPRAVGGISQHLPEPCYRRIQPVLVIDKCARRPKLCREFLPGDDRAAPFKQTEKQFQRLFLKANPDAVFSQLAGLRVQLKHAESQTFAQRFRPGFIACQFTTIN